MVFRIFDDALCVEGTFCHSHSHPHPTITTTTTTTTTTTNNNNRKSLRDLQNRGKQTSRQTYILCIMSCNHDDVDDDHAISAPAEAATNSGTGSLPKGVGQPQTVNLLAQNALGISGRSAPGGSGSRLCTDTFVWRVSDLHLCQNLWLRLRRNNPAKH